MSETWPHAWGASWYEPTAHDLPLGDPARYPCPTCRRPAARVEVTHGKDDGRDVSWYRPIYVCHP